MRRANFGRTGVRRGGAMVLLDRALVSSYRLSIVCMPLTEAVWPQCKYMWCSRYPRFGSELVPRGSGRVNPFAYSDSLSIIRAV